MVFQVITLFPSMFDSYASSSIIGRAVRNKKIKINFYNPRDFTKDKWRRVDQKPYGGGPGMVLEPLSLIKAVDKAVKNSKTGNCKIIWLSPGGKQFTNEHASKTAKKYKNVIIICGRYEGVDERVRKIFKAEEISIGPYVLTGGELPAMVIMDAMARQVPGVLGKLESLEERRVSSNEVYTRPEVLEYKGRKYKVPKILLSGDHKKIEEWKMKRRKR